jgi:hypothetical protein
MATLTNLAPQSSFAGLLNTLSTGGLTPVLQVIQDGFGNNSILSLSTTALDINGTLSFGGVPLLATPDQIDNVCVNASFSAFTTAVRVPSGTTAQRPGVPFNGDIRYNTTTNRGEMFANGVWQDLTA